MLKSALTGFDGRRVGGIQASNSGRGAYARELDSQFRVHEVRSWYLCASFHGGETTLAGIEVAESIVSRRGQGALSMSRF